MPQRLLAVLAAAWLGLLLTIGLIAAPAAFAALERAQAAAVVSRLFAAEAAVSLVVAMAVVLLERWRFRLEGLSPTVSRTVLLALVALFCTVAGYYALQPMMDAARAGQGRLSFGQLHGISLAFYALKAGAVAALAWRSSSKRLAAP